MLYYQFLWCKYNICKKISIVSYINSNMDSNIKALVFEGGGVLGIAHVGALLEAQKYIDMSKITHFSGSSVGSIVAALCACRISVNKINDAMNKIDFKKLLDDDIGIVRDANRLWKHSGYYKGNALEKTFGDILQKYIGNSEITLGEVYSKYNSYLIIPVTEIYKSSCETKYFTPDNAPNEKVKSIVRYSSSYPFMFASKNNYSDGGILDNYPIKKMAEYFPLNNILGFKFSHDKDLTERPDNVIDFASALIGGLREKANKLNEEELLRSIIIQTCKYRAIDFYINDSDKKIIFNYGVKGATEYFKN